MPQLLTPPVRRWGLAAIAIAGLTGAWHGTGGVPFFRDRVYYFMPQYEACRQAIAQGEVPLWNPFVNCGQPLLATWQAGLGSPFSLPFLLLPWEDAVPVFWLMVLPFAAAGMFALGTRAGLSPFGAAVAAVVFALSAPLRTLGEWPPIVVGLACLPALLAALADLARGRKGAAAAVGMLLSLQVLAGQPRQVIISAVAAATWLLALEMGRERRPLLPVAAALAAAVGAAAAVAAFQLLPVTELWAHSDRRQWGVPPETVSESFLHASDLMTLVSAGWWGGEGRVLDPGRLLMPRLYLGWLGLLLAACGASCGRSPAWRFAVIAIPVALLVALGGPAFDFILRVSGYGEPALRYLGHFIMVALPAVALLAGRGAEHLLAGARGTRRAAPAGLVAAAVAVIAATVPWTPAGGALARAVAGPWSAGWLERIRIDSAVSAAAVLVAALALRFPGRPGFSRAILAGVLALDLGWAARAHEARAPRGSFPRPPVLDRFDLARGRVFSPTWTVQVWDDASPTTQLDHYRARWELLSPNAPLSFRVRNAYGYEPFAPATVRQLFGAFDNDLGPVMPGLAATGVRWILGPLSLAPRGWVVRDRIAGGWGLVENPSPAPAVRVLPASSAGSGWKSLARLPAAGSASVERETWNSIEIAARSAGGGLLTPTTPWYPGWRAGVDGTRRPVVRAGGIFLAADVPAGRSRVRFDYAPLSFALGLFLSAVALGAVTAAAGLPRHG